MLNRVAAWVEKRQREVEDMRTLLRENKDANLRLEQQQAAVQMLMSQSEAGGWLPLFLRCAVSFFSFFSFFSFRADADESK